ncbi:MAG: hypothetical protein EOM50_04690 [Erysipelotrichia bacterium]|nr:hypothetical protein [Erysipelotrichia bacterium]
MIGLLYYLLTNYEISKKTILCEDYSSDLQIESNSVCRKFSNKLGIKKGVYVEIQNDMAYIIADNYYNYYDSYYNFEKVSTKTEQIYGYDLTINYYKNDSWDGIGEVGKNNLVTIYSSFHLSKDNQHIMGLGPNTSFELKSEEIIEKDYEEKIKTELFKMISRIIKN